MRNKRALWLSGVLLLVVGVGVAVTVRASWAKAAEGDEPLSGTWKVNLEKSKYDPGPAPTTATTATITIDGGMETFRSQGTDANGKPTTSSFTAKVDGPDAPIIGVPYADTLKIKRVNAHHYVDTLKKNGKAIVTVHILVADDGKSRTVSFEGKDQSGTPIHDKIWYDRAE